MLFANKLPFKKAVSILLLLLCFTWAQAQVSKLSQLDNHWDIVNGEIEVETITKSVRVDHEGKVVEKLDYRITYSTQTRHRLLSSNYLHLSNAPEKLAQATEWNRNAILVPELQKDANNRLMPPPPVQASISMSKWEFCNDKLILTTKEQAKGILTNFNVSSYIMISPRSTKEEADREAAIGQSIAANQSVLDENDRTNSIHLPNAGNGLFLYSFSSISFQGGGFRHKNNISGKTSYYDCSFNQWSDANEVPTISLPNQSSNIPSELKLKKSKIEGNHKYWYQNPEISRSALDRFIVDPSIPVSFTSTAIEYVKASEGDIAYTEESRITRITLKLHGKKPTVEAIVSVTEDFGNWIPKAGKDEKVPGNGVPVSVRLIDKNKGAQVNNRVARFRFELVSVSKEKGICTNYPLRGTTDFDLSINPETNPHLSVTADGQSAESKQELPVCTVLINAYDWGAFGKLKVTAKLSNGQEIVAILEDDKEKTLLTIPKDENDNRVADVWEKEQGVFLRNENSFWDEDNQPANQRRNGDGYTLYEEYRGFRTLTQTHVRTSPSKKDLFVFDQDGLVKTYFEPHNPAKLELHYVDPTMMKYSGDTKNTDNRWINFNSETYRYARQYALNVRKWSSGGDGTLGIASDRYAISDGEGKEGQVARFVKWSDEVAGYDYYNSLKQPLKNIYIVKIAVNEIERLVHRMVGSKGQQLLQQVFTKVITSTVIHEVGHALGIRHHANDDEVGVYQGVIDCAMRYNTDDEIMHPEFLRANYLLCKKGNTWKLPVQQTGKDGKTIYFFEDKPADNCFGQIDIKSDP